MEWVRIDDNMFMHPKILAAGYQAELIHVRAIQYCHRTRSDGFIPYAALTVILRGLPAETDWADMMVQHRLWTHKKGGYLVHDYLEYNESKAELKARQERFRAMGRKGAIAAKSSRSTTAYATSNGHRPTPKRKPPAQAPAQASSTIQDREGVASHEASSEASSEATQFGAATAAPCPRAEDAASWDASPWPSPEALAAMYNRLAPDNCPAVETLSPKRREKALRLLRQFPHKQFWDEVFAEYRRSRFLSGQTRPQPGHEGFRPDFDWLLSNAKHGGTENAVKVHDGAYLE